MLDNNIQDGSHQEQQEYTQEKSIEPPTKR